MVIITGDTHGNFSRIDEFSRRNKTMISDVMVILGDVGLNYFQDSRDILNKNKVNSYPLTLLAVKGNHEKCASSISSYIEKEAFGGIVYYEPKYPNLLFAKDGEVYTLKDKHGIDKKVLVIGGAYSVDKHMRLSNGHNWFEDEQPSEEVKQRVEVQIEALVGKVDYVFSHTCPRRYEPIEWFISGLDQEEIDKSTEDWLDDIYAKLTFDKWYLGHFHGSKVIDNMRFMFEDYVELGD